MGVARQRLNTEGAEVDEIDVGALEVVFTTGYNVGPVVRVNVGMEDLIKEGDVADIVEGLPEELIMDGVEDGAADSSIDG